MGGSERDEEPSGGRILRLIQIRLATPSLKKYVGLSGRVLQRLPVSTYGFVRCCFQKRQFKFQKRRQLFICTHNEALRIAMRVLSHLSARRSLQLEPDG